MNDKKLAYNFKSYLGLEDSSHKNNKGRDGPIEEFKPRILANEVVIGVAHNVLLFAPVNDKQSGRCGSLFVTNYKLSFVTDDQIFGACRQQSLLLGTHDVTLSMVSSIYELTGIENEESTSKWRRRLLRPSQAVPRKIHGLQIHCKNMRVFSFGFRLSPSGQGRTIATSLLHHAYPKRHDLLFAYEYKEPYYSTLRDVNMFQNYNDWKHEMERTNCTSWRISRANGTTNAFCLGAGEELVVPSSVLDCQLSETARHFRKGRVPIWVWSTPGGAALARSGELFSGTGGNGSSGAPGHAPESVLLEAVRRAHPKHSAPKIISVVAPPLQNSFKKLTNICTPNTLTNFWEQDGQFYSSLESSRWFRYVSECLKMASDAAEHLADNITIVLQEGDGMDYCAVISSLIQLLLDSYSRTIKGFQSLIQKEWIALGHPFSDRLGHIALEDSHMTEGDRDVSPVFLLFLDCCWQLQKQFPSSFEFTECYLTTLWDSAHNQLFDTFLFNSPRDRHLAVDRNLILRPVWDWKEQFTESEIQYFYNPIYSPPAQHTHPTKLFVPPSAIRLPGLASPQKSDSQWITPSPLYLKPNTSVQSMDIWQQCYLRWLSLLNLPGSGDIQYLLHNIRLSREIRILQLKISLNDHSRRSNGAKDDESSDNVVCPHPSTVGAFFPFIGNSTGVGDPMALLTTSLLEPNQELDSQSILNAPD